MTKYNDMAIRILTRYQTRNPFVEDLDANEYSIKELKEDPILRRFKNHKYYKAVIRCTTGTPIRRRRIIAGTFTPGIDTDQQTTQTRAEAPVEHRKDKSDITLQSLIDEIDNLQKIPSMSAEERVSHQQSINDMSDYVRWLQAKPVKSNFEKRILRKSLIEKMDAEFNAKSDSDGNRNWFNFLQSICPEGDKFAAPETAALHILDEYFHKNDEDIASFLSNLDKSKCGTVKWSVVMAALKERNINIEVYELLQGITVLQCYEGNKIDYLNFSKKMDDFRDYKWSRLMSSASENFSKDLIESLNSNENKDTYLFKRGFKRYKPGPRVQLPAVNLSKRKFVRKKLSERQVKPKQEVIVRPVEVPIKRIFWPGTNLDKLYPCFMPLDRRHPDQRHHPLFEIIHPEKPAERPQLKCPPFTNYTIYSKDKKI